MLAGSCPAGENAHAWHTWRKHASLKIVPVRWWDKNFQGLASELDNYGLIRDSNVLAPFLGVRGAEEEEGEERRSFNLKR